MNLKNIIVCTLTLGALIGLQACGGDKGSDAPVGAAVTWNPMALDMLDGGQKHGKSFNVLGDTSEMPGYVLDLWVTTGKNVRENPDALRAITGAWYEALSMLNGNQGDEVLTQIAAELHPDIKSDKQRLEFARRQLATTFMFWTGQSAIEYISTPAANARMEEVREFCFRKELMQGYKDPNAIGIRYPDGTIKGDANNVKLTWNMDFMREHATGKISRQGGRKSGDLKPFVIGASYYIGWGPMYYLNGTGLLQKWGQAYGYDFQFQHLSYDGSLGAFTTGNLDVVCMTNMEALDAPAAGGVDTHAFIVGDYSNGNDKIIAGPQYQKLSDLKGTRVQMLTGCVSEFVFEYMCEKKGVDISTITVEHVLDDRITGVFLNSQGITL